MTPIITGGSSAVVGAEELTLDGLELHTSPFCVEGFEHKPAKKLLELLRGPDSHGAKLLRVPKHETAEVVITLRVEQQADMDTALNRIGQVVDKLQEAERQSAGGRGRGLALVWSPAASTFTGTFYVLAGEVDVPKDIGYLLRFPQITITLTCDPFIYGAEVTTSTTTSSLPLLTATFEDIPGDVEAEARFIVTDGATQNRDYVASGVESFYYDAATSLLFSTSGMVYSPTFAATATSRAGSYSGSVLRATLSTTPVAVCGSGELTHKGGFRNVFRLYPSSDDISVRLAWRQGRDQWTTEPWTLLPTNAKWCEVDLGQTKIRPALLGTQSWQWRLEAKTTVAGDTLDVDFHAMVPTEYYGKARVSAALDTPTVFKDHDEFDQTAGALTAKTSAGGSTWAGAGDADDFSVETTGKTAQRTAVSDADANTGRYAVSGVAAFAAQVVQVDHKRTVYVGPSAEILTSGVLARYTDTSNYLLAAVEVTDSGSAEASYLVIKKRVAGTVTELARVPLDGGVRSITSGQRWWVNAWYTITVMVDASGRWRVWWAVTGTPATLLATGQDSALATGGALASGKPGIYDAKLGATAITRNYDNFLSYAATADAAIFSGQSLEFRSYGDDAILREDSTGTYWGRPGVPVAGRMWLPCAGTQDRTSRVAVMARRNDIETQPSENIADSTSLAVAYRPRWLVVPQEA